MFYLYFPEDKTEYIPAIIEVLFVVIIVFLVIRLFKRISQKELKKAELIEKQMQEYEQQHKHTLNS